MGILSSGVKSQDGRTVFKRKLFPCSQKETAWARLRMLQHAQRVSGNVSQTCRFFGVSRALFYIWKKRYEKNGLTGLRDQPRRPHHIRYRIPPEIVCLNPIDGDAVILKCRYKTVGQLANSSPM